MPADEVMRYSHKVFTERFGPKVCTLHERKNGPNPDTGGMLNLRFGWAHFWKNNIGIVPSAYIASDAWR
jgi:hypothetical protein